MKIRLLSSMLLLAGAPSALAAQGIHLGISYSTDARPVLAVLPVSSTAEWTSAGDSVQAILARDLFQSNRFVVHPPTQDYGMEARAWKDAGVDWVLRGSLRAQKGGLVLQLVILDAVFGTVKGTPSFVLPRPGAREFRMEVHAISDEVVRMLTGKPGYAASRIVFVRRVGSGKDLFMVDADGANLERVTEGEAPALSPAWSPSGRWIAYTSFRTGTPVLYERDLATGRDRVLSEREGLNITPAYAPDGRFLAFATTVDGNTEIATYDRERGCCWTPRTQGRRSDSLSPTYSPDGLKIALVSNRIGEPHIYVQSLSGGEARLVSAYRYGAAGYNTSPDWAPVGEMIAYHSRIQGKHQLAEVNAQTGQGRMLTNQFTNEDPSWAPDARHLVFTSPDRDGGGLFVLDTETGSVRKLLGGAGFSLPDWSTSLRKAQVF